MELQQAIINRRSIKQYEDSVIDDQKVLDALKLSAYAPNHGMREPWRVIYVKKDQLPQFASEYAGITMKKQPEKHEAYIQTISKLGGLLVVAGRRDRRAQQALEDTLAVGAYLQNLSLLLLESGIGSCIKTPGHVFMSELHEMLNINGDEMIYGFVHLTDNIEAEYKARKNEGLISYYGE